ncbi:MAG: hypothetical protein IT585_07250 [candidate division Zixibacteria bacterium]|nr:hypothetical protein [candidate division Zixibacteria bacterium]
MSLILKNCTAIVLVSGLVLFGCSGGSTPENPPDSLRSLLPGKTALPGLELKDTLKIYERNTVWDHLSSMAEVYLNNGLDKLASGTYASGANQLRIDLMTFRTPLDAFTMFAYHRVPPTRHVDVGQVGYLLADTLGFIKGSYVGRLIRSGSVSDDVVIEAAQMIAEKISDTTSLPAEFAEFPSADRLPFTESHWIRDQEQREEPFDFFGAQYVIAGDTMTLHLRFNSVIGLPTATEAFIGDQGKVEEWLMLPGKQGLFGNHPNWGNIYCTADAGTLVVVTGYSDRKSAQTLADRFIAGVRSN